jgi:hypothetical protein
MPVHRRAALRKGVWCGADCDVEALHEMPAELAFSIAAPVLVRQREELAGNLADLDTSSDDVAALRDAIPDLGPLAEALRRRKLSDSPRTGALQRAKWSLHRASIFLGSFAPAALAEDPVLADRLHDLTGKTSFLLGLVNAWLDAGGRRKTG